MKVYYHTFTGDNEFPTYKNLRVPTLLSIATLRAVNPDVEIIVLEGSNNLVNYTWGEYPDKLGFKVWHINFHLEENWSGIKGWQHLSRCLT